jgi:hypothetical protein
MSFALAAMFLLMRASVVAQGTGVRPTGPRIDPEAARIREEQQREMQLRNIGGSGPTDERAVRAAATQLGEDFKRIQVIRNDVARAVTSGGALDYNRVAEQTAEVRKRAVRMQGYLGLRAPDKAADGQPPQAQYDRNQMRDALARLCHRIDSFVANPRFKSPGVADVQATENARRDVQAIISLSADIRGSAERLARSHE